MRKKAWIAILLVAALALSGCALTVKDEAKDNARVIVSVNDKSVNKGTFNYVVEQTIAQNNYTNQMYMSLLGQSAGLDTNVTTVRASVLEDYKRLLIEQIKIAEKGFDRFTDEEKADMQAHAQEAYDEMLEQVKTSYLTDTEGKDEETLRAEAIKFAQDNGFNTLETYTLSEEAEHSAEKLRADVIKDVAVTDEELQAELDEQVKSAMEAYASSPSSYGSAVNNGTTVYYAPAGYRYVKQILLGFTDEDSKAISEANTALSAANTALSEAQTAYDAALTASESEGADTAALETAKQALADAQTATDAAKAKVDEAKAAAFAALEPTKQEVMDKIAAGEDFDALMETYNTDPGMQREPGKTNGYAVCEGFASFDTAFTTAAMALVNIGDVSEPVKSDAYGYYVIRYQADIPEGPVALDTVRDTMTASLLKEKQDAAYTEQLAAWLAEADVKTYMERLDQ